MAWLRPLLLPRLLVATGDVLTGYALLVFLTGEFGQDALLPFALLGGVLLHWAGPAWRDLVDRHDRPDSVTGGAGGVLLDEPSTASRNVAALAFTLAGWLCAMTGGDPCFLVGGALALAALGWGLGFGRVDGLGPLIAGAERGLLMALGMAAHGAVSPLTSGLWLPPALLAVYVMLAGLLAQQEKIPNRRAIERLRSLTPDARSEPEPESESDPVSEPDSAVVTGAGGDGADTAHESFTDFDEGNPETKTDADAEAEAAEQRAAVKRRERRERREREKRERREERAAEKQHRSVEAVLAWSASASAGDAAIDRGLLAVSGLALAAMPPVAVWFLTPATRPETWLESWLPLLCFAWLEILLLARLAAGWLRPTASRRRKLARTALAGSGLFCVGMLATAAHYARREWYPGFPMILPTRPEMVILALLLVLAVAVLWSRRRVEPIEG